MPPPIAWTIHEACDDVGRERNKTLSLVDGCGLHMGVLGAAHSVPLRAQVGRRFISVDTLFRDDAGSPSASGAAPHAGMAPPRPRHCSTVRSEHLDAES